MLIIYANEFSIRLLRLILRRQGEQRTGKDNMHTDTQLNRVRELWTKT